MDDGKWRITYYEWRTSQSSSTSLQNTEAESFTTAPLCYSRLRWQEEKIEKDRAGKKHVRYVVVTSNVWFFSTLIKDITAFLAFLILQSTFPPHFYSFLIRSNLLR